MARSRRTFRRRLRDGIDADELASIATRDDPKPHDSSWAKTSSQQQRLQVGGRHPVRDCGHHQRLGPTLANNGETSAPAARGSYFAPAAPAFSGCLHDQFLPQAIRLVNSVCLRRRRRQRHGRASSRPAHRRPLARQHSGLRRAGTDSLAAIGLGMFSACSGDVGERISLRLFIQS